MGTSAYFPLNMNYVTWQQEINACVKREAVSHTLCNIGRLRCHILLNGSGNEICLQIPWIGSLHFGFRG